MNTIKSAFKAATELRLDPFAIKRPMAETPEAVTPIFQNKLMERSLLSAQGILGYGQV